MRRLGCLFLCIMWLWSQSILASASVRLSHMVIRPALQSTQLILTLSQKTLGHLQYSPNPDRLILSLANTYKNFSIKDAKLNGSLIQSITTEQTANGVLHFIFKVPGKVRWQVRFEPTAQDQINLIIDVTAAFPNHLPKKNISQQPVKAAQQLKTILQNDFIEPQIGLTERPLVGRARLEAEQVRVASKPKQFTVVIDAGHGGHDSGARGATGTLEKNVVLAIAKKLAAEINATSHMKAVLTRKGDYFVSLRNRLMLARKANADLFIAIHADAYFERHATGASVYALSQRGATSEAARWLAQRDNYSELGEVALDDLKDRSPMLRSVLIDLAQTATIQQSIWLGNRVLDALDRISALHHSHVEQAPFVVLKSPDIPSILVETGFITNPKEERRLDHPLYQDRIAHALFQGVVQYQQKYAKS